MSNAGRGGALSLVLRLILALAMTGSSPVLADFADGARAYDGGDYATAFAEWRSLAVEGHIESQVALANMHRFGEGRPVDAAAAVAWYRRAARQGNAIAQINLAEHLERGIGVARNLEAAYRWMAIAAKTGHGWALRERARLAGQLSIQARARADEQARAFTPEAEKTN